MTLGRKMRDGLRAFLLVKLHRYDDQPAGYWFADAALVRMGYPEKVAGDIIDRLARRELIEWGTTKRTGWLTGEGIRAARAESVTRVVGRAHLPVMPMTDPPPPRVIRQPRTVAEHLQHRLSEAFADREARWLLYGDAGTP